MSQSFDIIAIEDLTLDLIEADKAIRKSLKIDAIGPNPAEVISRLCSLSRAATSAAQAIAIGMANERALELLEAQLAREARQP